MKIDRKIKTEAVDEKSKGTKKGQGAGAKSARKLDGKHPPMPYEHAPIGIVESSLDGKFLNVNKEFCRILGYKKQELLKGDIEFFTYEEDYPIDWKLYQQLVAGEIPFYKLEKRYVHKAGGVIWAELTRSAVRNARGKILYIVSTVLDIHERKRSEAQVKWQAHLLAELADAVVSTDENFVLTGWNKAAEEIYGWKAEEVLGKNAQTVLQTDFITGTREAARQQAGATGSFSGEVSQVCKDGTRIIIEGKVITIRDEEGKIQGYISVNRDITERKRADDALRESQYRFSATYQYAPIGIVECSREGKYLNVNEEFCNLLRYPREELIGRGFKGITHEDDYVIDIRLHEKLVAGEIPFYKFEKRYIRKDGETLWAEITRSPVRDASGNVLYTIGTVLDISERKQVESALHESVERLRLATEAARMFTWEWDFENQVFALPDGFTKVLGFSTELLPKNSLEALRSLVPAEDLQSIVEAYQQTIDRRGDLYALPCRVINPENGQVVWMEVSAKIVYNQAGMPERMFGVAQNVTEAKKAQDDVAIISRVPEENPNPVMRLRPDGTVIYANGPAKGMLEAWRVAGDQTVPAELQKRVEEAFASSSKKIIEITQNEKTFSCTLAPILEAGYVNFYGNEITARKRAEQALREFARQQGALYRLSDQLLRTASFEDVFNAALDAILNALQCDRASILLFDDADVMRFVAWRGLSEHYREATTGHSPWTADTKDPEPISIDDIRTGELSDALRAVIAGEGIGSLAFIPLVSNGKLIGKFMVYFNRPHEFSEGELDLSLAIAHHIAFGIERKRAEEALAREQELLKRLFETMPVMVSMYDPEANSIRLNAEFERLIGWKADEVPVVSLLESLYPDPDYRQQVLQRMAAVAGTNEWVEVQLQTRDGRKVDSLWSNISIMNDQKLVRGIALGIDITERKRMEQDLTRERELLNRIFESIPVMLTVYEPSTQLLRVNSQFEKLIGWSSEEAAGTSLMEAVYPEPNYREEVWQFMERAAEDEWMDIQMRTRAGRTLETSWSNRRLSNDLQVGIGIDITERRQADQRLALLAEISEMLRNFDDPGELLYAISKAVGEHLQVKRCLFNEIDLENDLEIIHRDYCRGVPSVAGVHKVTDYSRMTTAEIASGKTIINNDAKSDPRTAPDYERMYEPNGERSYIAVPMMREHRWVASLWVSDEEPRQWSPEEVSLLETIAERTWSVIEKLRIAEELRAKEAELEEMINQTPFMLTRCTRDLHYRFVSRAYAEMIGRRPEDVAGKPIAEIMGEEGFRTISPYVENVLRGETVEYEAEVNFQGVGAPFLHVAYTPDRDQQGNVIGWFASIVDITERKRAEEALRRNEKMFSTLINAAPFGVYLIDSEFRLRAINKGSEAVFGGIQPLIGRDFAEILRIVWQEPFATEAIERFRHTLRTGESFISPPIIEERANIDEIQSYDWQIHRIPLADGTYGVVCYFYDLSEQKRMEATVRASETLYRTIARSIPGGGVYVVDKDFRYLVAEGPVTEAFGLSRAMLEGRTVSEAFPDERGVHMEERLKRNFAGETVSFETQHNGRVFWTQQAPLFDSIGQAIILTIDITERKRAEEALRESEERFRAILRQATAGIVRKDADGRLIFVNQAFCNMLGYTEGDLLGKTIWEFMHEEDVAENKRSYERLMMEGLPFKQERRFLREDGSVIWVDASVSPIMDAEGKPQSAVAVEVDITGRKHAESALQQLNVQLEERVLNRTAKLRAVNQTLRDEIAERKRVEEALRQSEATARSNEEKLSTLFDLLPVGISFLDPKGQIIQMNSALANILKLSKEQLLRGQFRSRQYIRTDGTPMPAVEFASVRALTENRTIHNVETGVLLENGEIVWTNVSAAPVHVADVGAVVVTVDITDSKRAERALQESHARLRILSQRLVDVQEEERRALARELHDRVGQTLAALNINLIIINSQLTPEVSQQIGTRLNDSMKLVAETIALVRDVMTDLRPSVLDDYGLEAALESHVAQYTSRYEIETRLEKPAQPLPRLGPSIEMTVLRIAQEALMNIAKHAHASQVSLWLRQEGNNICLTIRDNGLGIESWERANRPGSHGLTIMRERAEAFGGTLSLDSVPGEGTTVEISIPIRTNAQKENGQEEEKKR